MEKNTETEIKLIIAKKDVKALVASPLVAKKTKKGSHKTVKLVNIYFDTRDLLLHQAGIAYQPSSWAALRLAAFPPGRSTTWP